MARILLVDDEPLTTDTLQTLILDAMPEMEVVSLNSSVQAVEWLEKNVCDIVVTDVSMPRISGLELLEHIRKQGTQCYVIVLTAYDSFDYAYKASQYEDVRFVLKIEPPEVILEALRTGLARVRQYYSVERDNRRLQKYMEDTQPLLRQMLLEKLLIYGEALPERSVCESCGIRILPGVETWLAVTGRIASQEKRQEICFLVLSMLQGRGIRADAWYGEACLVFLMQPGEGETAFLSAIGAQLDRMIEGVGPEISLSFAVSSQPVPWEALGEGASSLVIYARRSLENSRILLKNPLEGGRRRVTQADVLRWRNCMERGALEQLMEAFRDSVLREGYPQGRQTCALLMQMLLRESFGDGCLEGLRVDGRPAEAVLFHGPYETLDSWLEDVRYMLEALFSGSSTRRMTETEETINRVNRYIREHFAEPVSLTQIAEHFSYNSSYLSRIYKQKMQEGINEHIIRTRIEEACRLLKDSGMSVTGIAEQCGFQTTKYFITVFKRVTGLTPKAWREIQTTGATDHNSTR